MVIPVIKYIMDFISVTFVCWFNISLFHSVVCFFFMVSFAVQKLVYIYIYIYIDNIYCPYVEIPLSVVLDNEFDNGIEFSSC